MSDSTARTNRGQGDRPCPYCGGTGEVEGIVCDVQFFFACPCAGGSEDAIRWLLQGEVPAPPGEDWII